MERIRAVFEKEGIREVGAVSFGSVKPLLDCRAVSRIPKNAKTVIAVLFPYYIGDFEKRNISRYAIVPDYHNVVGDILQKICGELSKKYSFDFVPFVDNSPIREVDTAVRAGLGVLGENSLLINPEYGSFVFIGTIVTDMELDFKEYPVTRCIGCGKCKKACPSGCITDGKVDKTRCLSDITQKKGELTDEEISLVKKGKSLWGCDICQEVCPMQTYKKTPIKEFYADNKAFLEFSDLTKEAIKDKAYSFRGEKPLIRNYEIIYKE